MCAFTTRSSGQLCIYEFQIFGDHILVVSENQIVILSFVMLYLSHLLRIHRIKPHPRQRLKSRWPGARAYYYYY